MHDATTPNSDDNAPASLLNSAASSVSREFHQFIGDLETLIKSVNGDDQHGFASASASLQKRATALKQRFDAVSTQVQQKACSSAQSADAFAHSRPWYLAGIGACLGIAAGMVLAKRN